MKTTIATAAVFLMTTVTANAEICFLQIKHTIEMQGFCEFDPFGNGSFFAEDIDDPDAFVYFNLDEPGVGSAMWSGRQGKAQFSLGTLHREGACWSNNDATLCAWEN